MNKDADITLKQSTLTYVPEEFTFFVMEDNLIKTEEESPTLMLPDNAISTGFLYFLSESGFGEDIEKLVRERNTFYKTAYQIHENYNECIRLNYEFKTHENKIRAEVEKSAALIKSLNITTKNQEEKIKKLERALSLANDQINKLKQKNEKIEKTLRQEKEALNKEHQEKFKKVKSKCHEYILRCVSTILSIEFAVKEAYTELMGTSGFTVETLERKNGEFITLTKKPICLDHRSEKNDFINANIDADYNYCIEVTNGQRSYIVLRNKDGSIIYDNEKRDDYMKLKTVTNAIQKAFDDGGIYWDYLDISTRTELDNLQDSKDKIDYILSEILKDSFFKEISENVMQIMKNKDR